MFSSSIFPNSSNRSQQSESNVSRVRRNFQQSVRQKQLQGRFRKMRQEMMIALSHDYSCLKNIDLSQTIREFRNINVQCLENDLGRLDDIVSSFFSYSISDNSDHLFELVDERDIERMIYTMTKDKILLYEHKPRLFIRALYVVSKYVQYCRIRVPLSYLDLVNELFSEFINARNIYQTPSEMGFFTQSQLKQIVDIIFLGLATIEINNSTIESYFFGNNGYLDVALKEASKIINLMSNHHNYANHKEQTIMLNILALFKQILSFQFKEDEELDFKQRVLDIDLRVVDLLLEFLSLPQQVCCSPYEEQIVEDLRWFFIIQIEANPQILLNHNFDPFFQRYQFYCHQIADLTNPLIKLKANNRQPNKLATQLILLEKKVMVYSGLLELMLGVNIPDQDEVQYYVFFEECLQRYVMPTFTNIYSINNVVLNKCLTKMTKMLVDICLDEGLLKYVLEEVVIVSKLRYCCQSKDTEISLRKYSLHCFANMAKIVFNGESNLRSEVLEIFNQNHIMETFIQHLGIYADKQLNFNLLQALSYWLQTQTPTTNSEHHLWNTFCSLGGLNKLENTLHISNNKDQCYGLAAYLLDLFDPQ